MSAHRKLRPIALAAIAVVFTMLASGCGLPNIAGLKLTIPALPQTSLLFDDHGQLITSLHAGENRTLVPIGEIPTVLQDAVIATEDQRFYQHHGIDVKAIVRAAVRDATSGRVEQGGSTITEQLVKNTITGSDRTVTRKIKDAILAYKLEDKYPKSKILEMYLNTVYFGQGAYGVQAATHTYFSESVADLTLPQAATLAGLISSPENYDPVFHPDLAIVRRNLALAQMDLLGMIDRPQYLVAVAAPLGLKVYVQRHYPAAYFVDYVRKWFLQNPAFGSTYQQRYDKLFTGGLRIYTTVDLKLQQEAEQAVGSILTEKGDPYGAMTVSDPNTGEIKAMVGGRDYFSEKDPFAKLNLATGGATGRQAGSSFKPFALVTALDQGITPQQVYSAPGHIDIQLPRGYNPPVWPVSNYEPGGRGSETLEQATIHSTNTVYAQLIMQVGPANVVRTAREMGITSPLAAVPSAVLGSNDVNTLEMASAYGTLATMGSHTPPVSVTKITDASGRIVFRGTPDLQPVVNPAVAWTTDQILEKVVQEGTGTAANIGRPAAGKTGTAQDWADAWFVGYVPQLVAAVWVGFPKARVPMVTPRVRIAHVAGGTWPAAIWHAFMTKALKGTRAKDFVKPPIGYVDVGVDLIGMCLPNHWTLPSSVQVIHFIAGTEPTQVCTQPSGPQVIPVPSVVGLLASDAENTLASYGFAWTLDPSSTQDGMVTTQDPSGGSSLLQLSLIHI